MERKMFSDYIVPIVLVALSFVFGFIVGQPDQEANKLWDGIKAICDLKNSTPEMQEVKLPNGNLGFSIVCKKEDQE